MLRKIIRVILVFLSLSLSHHAFGENGIYLSAFDESEQDAAEMARLMKILDEHTEIATKTRLNADYVPGMVTVLYREDMEARGIHSVWEALRLVPGMDMTLGTDDGSDMFVRGISDTYFAGNTKILLDGVSMNVLLYAEALDLIQIPVELLDRIEVIRGPGSAIHGEFAYTSVVNIITRKEENVFFIGSGQYDDYRVGGVFSWTDENFHVNLSLYATERSDTGLESGPDILHGMGMGAISHAPGPVNDGRDCQSLFFDAAYDNTSVSVRYAQTDNGGSYGMTYVLPPPEERKRSDQHLIEVRQKMDFSSSLALSLRLGWMKHEMEIDEFTLYPPGFMNIYPDGMIAGAFYEEQRVSGGMDMVWKGWDQHTLLLGCSVSKTEREDMRIKANYDMHKSEPLPYWQYYDASEDWNRTISSVTFQDEFRVSEAFTLTSGLRYDSYDDVGEAWSPRIAAVWRVTDHHILKAQYARAFRPPTFAELYLMDISILSGSLDLGLSDIATYEMGYVYKQENTVIRTTVFCSQLDNMAINEQSEASTWGSELEIERRLTRFLRLSANLSYVNTEDKSHGKEIEGSINWLANASLIWRPHEKTAFSLWYRYVGDRNRDPKDPRDDLKSQQTIDVTANLFNLYLRGLTFRAGIKNLFDEEVRTPAPMSTDFLGNSVPSYPEDYPHSGREWWLKLSYTF